MNRQQPLGRISTHAGSVSSVFGGHGGVFNTDEQSPARAIRKSNQRAHYLVQRGKVAFEFQRFSLTLANDFSEVEHTQKSTRKRTDVASFRAGVFAGRRH